MLNISAVVIGTILANLIYGSIVGNFNLDRIIFTFIVAFAVGLPLTYLINKE